MTTPVDYENLAEAYARHRHVVGAVFEPLVAVVGPTTRVLEIGCGTGNYITGIRARVGCRCTGLDPSRAMLAKISSNEIETVLGSAEHLPFPDRSFDFVFSVNVIHHVADSAGAFREAYRTLEKGGMICTATASEWIIRNRLMSQYFPGIIESELRRYQPISQLLAELADAGFSQIREEMVESPYQLDDTAPYREKAFSALACLEDAAFSQGLRLLEEDVARGPVGGVARQTLLWGSKG
jgi:ubiquinone/menaquinone biosynthesis C-methylase UbiE